MKLLLESWKHYINENINTDIWYHTTSPASIDSIMKYGLKVNSPFNKSLSSQSFVKEIYGLNPIYVSKEEGRYKNGVILAVDVSGLPLTTDIPTLISDYYAQLGESLDHIWFEEDYTPFELFDFVDRNGAIYFEDLLDPNSPITKAMIDLTGTAAIMQDISPDKIKIIGEIK